MRIRFLNFLHIFFAFLFFLSCTSQEDQVVTISTDFGEIELILFDQTPKHKANFLKLAQEKFYDSTAFHRVINGFMIQGGDINTKNGSPVETWGQGNPDYTLPLEVSPNLMHVRGALAAARKPDAVNPNKESNGSQFYIVHNPNGEHRLNMDYTVFGQVLRGMEVVDSIAQQPVNEYARPLKDIRMKMKVSTLPKSEITAKYGYIYPKD